MQNLDLKSLRTFVLIAEQGSFAAAADSVFRTQSAVTQRIQRLETIVGKPLFHKVGRTKQLTEQGVRLLDYARRILSLHDEACASFRETTVTGEVRLGAPDDATINILPNLLVRFSRTFPGVRVTINIDRSAFLMEALKQGTIDMAISTREDASVPRVRLRTLPTVWFSAAEYKLARNGVVPLVLHDEPSLFRGLALDALKAANLEPCINYISGSLSGIRAAVRAGLGVTARCIESVEPTFKVLAEADGLPRLPDVSFYLYLRSTNATPTARLLFGSLKDAYDGTYDVDGVAFGRA